MKRIIIILLLVAYHSVSAQDAAEFTRQKDYERLTLGKDQLQKLMKALEYYHHENPPDSTQLFKKHSVSCEISRNNESRTLNGFRQIEKIDFGGKDYTGLTIEYSNNHRPISTVRLVLDGNFRRLIIRGTQEQKVNAVFREIDEQLVDSEDVLSFVDWSTVLFATLFCLFVLAQFIQLIKASVNAAPETLEFLKWAKICSIIFTLCCLIFLLTPYKIYDFFPGFKLTEDTRPFWDKYANLIGISAIIFPIIWGAVKFLMKFISIVGATTPAESGQNVETLPENQTDAEQP